MGANEENVCRCYVVYCVNTSYINLDQEYFVVIASYRLGYRLILKLFCIYSSQITDLIIQLKLGHLYSNHTDKD